MEGTQQASELFFEGLRALGSGDLAAAERNFQAALKLAPGRPSVLINLSVVYIRMGRLGQALPLARSAVQEEPGNALARLQLGTVQFKLGMLDEALESLDAAVAADLSLAEAQNTRGNVLKELARPEEALQSFDAAIRLKPDYAEAFSNRGSLLRLMKRREEALESFRKALALRPSSAEAHNNLGNLLNELNRPDEALAAYDKAIGLRPDYSEAHGNRGNALAALNRVGDAEASYQRAIELGGAHAEPWLGLARIRSETGQFEAALEMYDKARTINPNSAEALCGIAENRKFSAGDPLIGEFEKMLLLPRMADEDRSRLHHAYAKVCNDVERFDDAMRHFARGKSLLTSQFDPVAHARRYDSLKALFTPGFFAERAGYGLADERPVFIVGMPRSGTTLTEQILASHHAVEGLGELQDLPRIAHALAEDPSDPARFSAAVRRLGPDDVLRMAQRYLQAYRQAGPARLRLIDKEPHNYEWLGLIALMFPKARVIHCRRDPLDNCVSMYMQKFNGNHGYNQDLAALGSYYRSYESLMAHWRSVLPLALQECVYEETISDFETSARRLVAFLGLPWDPDCLNFHAKERRIDTPSRWQVRQPLYDKSVGRWRRYEAHLAPLKSALGLDRLRTTSA